MKAGGGELTELTFHLQLLRHSRCTSRRRWNTDAIFNSSAYNSFGCFYCSSALHLQFPWTPTSLDKAIHPGSSLDSCLGHQQLEGQQKTRKTYSVIAPDLFKKNVSQKSVAPLTLLKKEENTHRLLKDILLEADFHTGDCFPTFLTWDQCQIYI